MKKQEALERIKLLEQVINEKSRQVNPNISYSLNDIISGKLSKCPNQKLLNEIFTCQDEIKNLQKSLED